MTLAVAILFGISIAAQPVNAASQAPQQQGTPANSSAEAPATQEGSGSSQAAPAETKPPAGGSTAKQKPASGSSNAKKPHRKKRVAAPGCDPATPPSGAPASNSSSAAPPDSAAAGSNPAQANGTSTAPKNCPPSKIIVRQGGTAEPSIQLAGSPSGNQGSQKRDAANQMLELTEGNLKKIAGRQLSATQQDAVSQIRQFVDQSKAALAAGDSERAHTLAWKAELLSEDLVKPQ